MAQDCVYPPVSPDVGEADWVFSSDLTDWFYCNLKFAMRLRGAPPPTPRMERGTEVHAGVASHVAKIPAKKVHSMEEARTDHARGATIFGSEVSFRAPRLKLWGRPDLFIWKPDVLEIFELKTGRAPGRDSEEFHARVWNSDGAQVISYGLLLAENQLSRSPDLHVLYAAADLRTELRTLTARKKLSLPGLEARLKASENIDVPFQSDSKSLVLAAVKSISAVKAGQLLPHRSHSSPSRCRSCDFGVACRESLA